ncbi:MAG TPA: chemotaxis protein CheA [Terriglobales bacterium]|jgi:two-component system chemotaxis sensor kinase CheA|nr:chemotaxis protein CheA [Terriglobales bacterium]
MTLFSDERGAELRALFFESAQELLQSLNDETLKLEQQPGDQETIRSVRRAIHTLKGDAAACGFRELSELAHELEDALALESSSAEFSLVELAFTAADTFEAMLAAYQQNVAPPDAAPLRKMIAALVAGPTQAQPEAKKASAEWDITDAEQLSIQKALGGGNLVYRVTVQIDPACAMPIAARQLILNALQTSGEIVAEREKTAGINRLQFLLATRQTAEQVATNCTIPTVVSDANVTAVNSVAVAEAPVAASTEGLDPVPTTVENTLRVDAERIDAVLNLVGELIIGKSMLQQTVQDFLRRNPKDPLRGRFTDAMGFQARVLNDLQRSVMKIRMVPVEQLFRRFPRMVRDVARQCEKQVDLVVSGVETDLDKGLLDSVAEPLTHLVRNAISHGIETPEERTKARKSPRGTLRLHASHQGNQVIIEISDDGHGIDAQKVKLRALQKNLISAEEAARLTEPEIIELLFRPGFSTAEQITEISGRGVGLDVVRSVLQRLKGVVDIETNLGQGTTFRLRLPLTLAIIKALLFRVEGRLYAVPLNAVAEITRAHESDLHQVNRYEVLQLRGQALSLIRLGRPPVDATKNPSKKIFVLVMSVGDRKLGLIVDALESEEELVIKALDDNTVATDLVSGASILGDGRVVLILNLAAIIERSFKASNEQTGEVTSGLLLSQSDKVRLSMQAAGGHS